MQKNVLCPVCGKYVFEKENDFDICPVCEWENDGVQMDKHDYWGGANELSVNQYRMHYELSLMKEKETSLKDIDTAHRTVDIEIYQKYCGENQRITDSEKLFAELRDEHDKYVELLISLLNA